MVWGDGGDRVEVAQKSVRLNGVNLPKSQLCGHYLAFRLSCTAAAAANQVRSLNFVWQTFTWAGVTGAAPMVISGTW